MNERYDSNNDSIDSDEELNGVDQDDMTVRRDSDTYFSSDENIAENDDLYSTEENIKEEPTKIEEVGEQSSNKEKIKKSKHSKHAK